MAVPPDQLADGWARLRLTAHGGPLVALALGLGLGWVGRLLLLDAVVSPTATAMAYMGAASRVGWMMGRCGLLPNVLGRINRQAVPSVALLISLALGIGLLLLGPGWQSVVSLLTATLVIALAMGPVSLAALRLQLPETFRPYRLPCARLWCPLAFVLATWAISWCGTTSLRGAVLIVLLPAIGFVLLALRGQQHGQNHGPMQTGQQTPGEQNSGEAALRPAEPASGAVVVSLSRWPGRDHRLAARAGPRADPAGGLGTAGVPAGGAFTLVGGVALGWDQYRLIGMAE